MLGFLGLPVPGPGFANRERTNWKTRSPNWNREPRTRNYLRRLRSLDAITPVPSSNSVAGSGTVVGSSNRARAL
jgi:hypothetical protein